MGTIRGATVKMGTLIEERRQALNAICPYFTMFPLSFPLSVLSGSRSGQTVIDPFCGRGTTNYASRLAGLTSIGIDSSPVAVALAEAKLVSPTPEEVLACAAEILACRRDPEHVPTGEFWEWAYDTEVLRNLCIVREALLRDCSSDSRIALRALLMGALHGPRAKIRQSYLSNQSPRTYAPKPKYAVRFWKERELRPTPVDFMGIIEHRANRYFSDQPVSRGGQIMRGDSRDFGLFEKLDRDFQWVITSPPYYGMRTYLPDQWLRQWFVGGAAEVDYSQADQLIHSSPENFVSQLRVVWLNLSKVCSSDAQMVVRFGAINSRNASAYDLISSSIQDSGWRLEKITSAGYASAGRRQALHINSKSKPALEEYDVWSVRD